MSVDDEKTRVAFLLRELNHRVRNTLTMMRALIAESAASASSVEDFAQSLDSRLGALVDIYDALGRQEWRDVQVGEMVRMALASQSPDPDRVEIVDDDCVLPPAVATPLFMALHELSVNAIKHGALSIPEGRVRVDLDVDPGRGSLEISWRERGGPPAHPPRRRGFGLTLIERGLEYEVGGSTRLEFRPEGLEARITVPLSVGADSREEPTRSAER